MRLSWILLLLFILEIWLLITWGAELGLVGTLLEFALSLMIGTYLVRTEGFGLLAKVNHDMQRGETPHVDMMPNFLTIIAGILLIIPGFLTDMLAVLSLLPWLKNRLLQHVWSGLEKKAVKKRNKHRQSIIIDQKDD